MSQQIGWRARDHDGEVVASGDLTVDDNGRFEMPNLSHLPLGSYEFEMDPIQMAGERVHPTGRPRKSRRERKREKGQRHQQRQRKQREYALEESREAARQQKKGAKGVEREMEKRGYRIGDNGAWVRDERLLPPPKHRAKETA